MSIELKGKTDILNYLVKQMITRLVNILIPHKLVEMILAWIFPVPEKTKEEKMVEVMIKYFNLINDTPCDEVTIRFYDDDYVEIYLIYNSWERAYEYIKQEDTLGVEMGDMFPYRFVTSHLVSEV
jgi:hypothetical protein